MHGPFLPRIEQWTLYALFAVTDALTNPDQGVVYL